MKFNWLPAWRNGAGPLQNGVDLPVFVVFFRMIEGVMKAPAFFAASSGIYDQSRHFDEIPQFQEFGGDPEIPVKLLYFPLQIMETSGGTLQSFGRSDDRNVVPHQAADLIPVVINHDELIHVSDVAAFP